MPAPGQTHPESRRTRLLDWLSEHPGRHRAAEVAKALDDKTQYVANELGRLARSERVVREQVSVPGRKLPVTVYRHPDHR